MSQEPNQEPNQDPNEHLPEAERDPDLASAQQTDAAQDGSDSQPKPKGPSLWLRLRRFAILLWRFAKKLWGWIKVPFILIRNWLRHLNRYYEPWMLSSVLLLGVAALLTAWWLLMIIPNPDELPLVQKTLPWLIGALAVALAGLIGFSFWKPNARNPFTMPLYLRRFYRPWMLSLLALVAIGGMIFGFWKLQARNPAAIQPEKPIPDQSISLRFEDVELRGRKQGTPFFTILADRVEVTRDNRYVDFKMGKAKSKPHGEFYNLKDWEEDPSGIGAKRRAITWEANEARYDTVEQNLSMKGAVRIKTDAGDTILTEEMLWNRRDETLTSNTRTRVHTHQDTNMVSNRVKVETKTKALTLEGQVFIDMSIGGDRIIDVEEFED